MKLTSKLALLLVLALLLLTVSISSPPPKVSAENTAHDPTWWSKYEFIRDNGSESAPATTTATSVGSNVDVSSECGPQSETFITINPNKTKVLAAGSNEIFRLPMRGYFSTNGGTSWGGVDLPLPPSKSKSGFDFGSDPTLAFDSSGNLFYGYIIVDFSGVNSVNGFGINGTAMAVAR